ncbi:MAG: CPCC family cysteine-rich protein [bacterium]
MWAAVDFTGWDNTCPVCGKEDAFSQPGGYEVCHQCHWEDDPDQRNNPDSSNGANPFS